MFSVISVSSESVLSPHHPTAAEPESTYVSRIHSVKRKKVYKRETQTNTSHLWEETEISNEEHAPNNYSVYFSLQRSSTSKRLSSPPLSLRRIPAVWELHRTGWIYQPERHSQSCSFFARHKVCLLTYEELQTSPGFSPPDPKRVKCVPIDFHDLLHV